jgi:hypothetical protein
MDRIPKFYLNRTVTIEGCPVAKLPLTIVTPAKEIPADRQRASMVIPSGEGDDRRVEINNIHWDEAIDLVAISQLTRLIAPPTLNAVTVDKACVGHAKGKDQPVIWVRSLPRNPYIRCRP